MLQAADFQRELLSAEVLYFTAESEVRVVVMENQDYRFMLMGDAVQSIMNLQDPAALEFAHQRLMLAQLDTLPAGARVLELGLGGGSAVRHANLRGLALDWVTVERSSEVINLYWDYFEPTPPTAPFKLHIELAESQQYLGQAKNSQFELILCDVYDQLSQTLVANCLNRLSPSGELVINWLPHMQLEGLDSTEFFAQLAAQHSLQHTLQTASGFANQIHRLRFNA
ncbi:spermidine synthase [Aliidiomarina maris]|uniref:Spermidine synthase n=1 Tax=Aliidiomarina maris TaxID=531312 RepID=A0A327WVR2_9GAMM|nr:hypothetical protein [Aliidiomarina maris]RAJ96361.1 hypothetical protein B0I24_10942 [Aliidiomarina maris]RUO22860.1 hypothetical protein CWE07_10305 [Aliidiomarina maris]